MKSAKLLKIINRVKDPSDILAKLTEANFTITEMTEDSDSVLHVLAKSEHTENSHFFSYFNVLISAGINLNIKNNKGQTILAQILSDVEDQDNELIGALIKYAQCEINTLDKNGNNYLQLAIIYCDAFDVNQIAKQLIRKGIDLSHKNNEGESVFDLILKNEAQRADNDKWAVDKISQNSSLVT